MDTGSPRERPSPLVRFPYPDYGPFMSQRLAAARRLGPLFVLGVVTATVPARAVRAQEAVRLRLEGAPGEWMQYTHQNDLVVELPSDLGGPATTRTTILLRYLVDAVSDSAIGYVTTLEDISLDVRPEPNELPDLSRLQGLRFYHTTTRDGRITGVRLSGETAEAGPELQEQVESWLSQLGFPPLPAGIARVGDEWSEAIQVPAAALGLALDYEVVQTRTTRLTAVRSTGGSTVAFLAVTTTWEPAPDQAARGAGVASLRGSAEQTIRFDTGRGRFLGGTGISELELVLTPQGGAQYVAVNASGRQVTGLTASGEAGSDGPGDR